MTTTSILNNELKVVLSLVDTIKVDTFREYDTIFNIEHEINAQYAILFKLRLKASRYRGFIGEAPVYIKEVYDLEMIYTDASDHEVILTKAQHAYACKELESKILITG